MPSADAARPEGSPSRDDVVRQIRAAGPLRHARPPGPTSAGRFDVVAGVPCSALPLPWSWAAQASLTAVPDQELVSVAEDVTRWLRRHAFAGWMVEVDSDRATLLAERLGLVAEREFDVLVSTGETPTDPVDGDVVPPEDDDEFLEVFGPDLAPMIRGQLDRPDWDVAVLRRGDRTIGCYRLIDLADTTYLGGVTVVPEQRGRGVGRALSAYATERARSRSALVWLQCEPGLTPFYTALGYEIIDRATYLTPSTDR